MFWQIVLASVIGNLIAATLRWRIRLGVEVRRLRREVTELRG